MEKTGDFVHGADVDLVELSGGILFGGDLYALGGTAQVTILRGYFLFS